MTEVPGGWPMGVSKEHALSEMKHMNKLFYSYKVFLTVTMPISGNETTCIHGRAPTVSVLHFNFVVAYR